MSRKNKRRILLWKSSFLFQILSVVLFSLFSCAPAGKSILNLSENGEVFPFGVIADCQYCSDPGQGVRKYAMSVGKLEACVRHFNQMNLKYVVHLGDFIDRDYESFSEVIPIYNSLRAKEYHVLGNHDFSVADEYKQKVPKLLDLKSRYYHFVVKDWRFVVLDGNDISFHAYAQHSEQYLRAETYYADNKITSPKWNGAISEMQLTWLEEQLRDAVLKDQKVIIYCHFPVFPDNQHNLWNAEDVLAIIDQYPCVKAYFNGHNHAGNYALHNGVHFVTFKGMVDTEETSYARVGVHFDRLEIKGFGREKSRTLKISR
ncbi:MAG: hypothetical protein HKN76_00715 [Saprospiraceae bacterium]|nr:hypothetical protein [Saprospiraceae bacterium]